MPVQILLGTLSLTSAVVAGLADTTAALVVSVCGLVVLSALLVCSFVLAARHGGPYDLEADTHVWDVGGKDAEYVKTLDVRFNYRTISITDYAWGGSNLFGDYDVNPGELVGTRTEGSRTFGIIALPAPRSRGERERIVIHHRMQDVFPKGAEFVELETPNRTKATCLEILWPYGRPPKAVRLVRGQRAHAVQLESLDDVGGRKRYRQVFRRPRMGEKIRLEWEW